MGMMNKEETLDWLYRLRSEIYVFMPKEWIIPMTNAFDVAIDTVKREEMLEDWTKKCRKFEADYENRLKADMVAILTDLQLDVEGQKFDTHIDKDVWNDAIGVCSDLIQQRINELKAESER